jgi:hypothetical protein
MRVSTDSWASVRRALLEAEADLHGDLEVIVPVFPEAAPDPADLEPVQVAQGLRGTSEGSLDRIANAFGGDPTISPIELLAYDTNPWN